MRYHSQNLNEKGGKVVGSMFWHGRAWLYTKREIHWEWLLANKARGAALKLEFGQGDGDDGIMFHICVPFLFSIFVGMAGIWRCRKPFHTGFAIHNQAVWFYPLTWTNESSCSDPWWRRNHSWSFPWSYDWYSTEILEHKSNLPYLAETVWSEKRGHRKKFLEGWDDREAAKKSVSETYPYTYTRKNGEVQNRKATVYVERMTHRMRWWPLLPFKSVRTSIWVDFDQEVGEGTGSWKGGTTGCGWTLNHGETPWECLRRMERERTFDR